MNAEHVAVRCDQDDAIRWLEIEQTRCETALAAANQVSILGTRRLDISEA